MRVLEEAPDLDDGSTTEDVIKRADKLLDVLRTLDDESVDEGYGPATSPNDAFSGSMPEGERTILKRIKASGLLEGKDNIAKEVDQRLTELGAIETEAGIYKKEYDSVSKHLIKKLTEAIAKLDSSMNTVKEMEGNWYDNINRFNARHLINSWKAFEAAYNHPLFGTQDENIYVDKFLPENSREMRNENKDIYDEFYKDDNRKKAIEQAEALMNPMAAVDKLKRQLADYDNTGAIRTLSYLGAVLRDGSVPGAERTELQELLEEGLEVDGYKVPFVMDANNRLLPNINVNELMGDPVDRALDRMEQYIKEKAEAINNSDATAGAQADAKIQHEFDYFTLFFDFLSPSEAAQKQYADGLKNLTIRYGDTKRACVICEYEPGADPTALRTINVAVDSAVDVTDYRAAIANGRKIDLDIGEWEKEDGAIKALDDELVEKVNATGDRRMLEDLSEDLNKITINGFAGGMKIKMKIEGGELKYEVTEAPSNQNNFKNAFKDRIDMLKAAYAAPRNEADIKKHKAWFKNMARFIESSAEAQQILIDNWEGTDEAKFSDGIFDYFVSVQSGEYREILDPNCLPEAARKMIRDLKDVIKTSHNLDDFRAYLDEIQRICGAAGAKLPNVESVFKAEKFKFEGEDMELVWATDHIEIKMTDQSKLEDSTRTKKKSIEAFMGDPEAKEVDIALVRKELLIYLEVAERLQGGSQKDKIKQVLAESHPVPAEGRAFRFTGDNLELEYCDISFIKDEYEINEVFDQVLFTAVKGVNFIRNGDHFKLWVDGAEFKNVPVVLQGFVSAISAAGGGKGVKLFRRQPDGTCFILDNINGKNLISVKERDEGGTKFVDIDLNFVVPSEHYELERN